MATNRTGDPRVTLHTGHVRQLHNNLSDLLGSAAPTVSDLLDAFADLDLTLTPGDGIPQQANQRHLTLTAALSDARVHQSIEIDDHIIESYNIFDGGSYVTRWAVMRVVDGQLASVGWRASKSEALALAGVL